MTDLPGTIKRPAGVTLVAVFAWINGTISVLGGIALIVITAMGTPADDPDGIPYTTAVVAIITGGVTVFLARWLLRASPTARMVVAFVQVIAIISALVSVLLGGDVWSAAVGILIAVVTLVLLYAGKAGRYFGTARNY